MRIAIIFSLILSVFLSGCIQNSDSTNIPDQNISQNQIVNDIDTEGDAEPSPNQESSNSLKSFYITVAHTAYNPKEIIVNKNDKVRLSVRTAAGQENHNHGITINEYNINVANTDPANPTVVEFTADKTGEFTIYCKTCWDGPFGRGHPNIQAKLIVK